MRGDSNHLINALLLILCFIEDIDVPDDTGQDNPPAYEDVAEPKPDTDKHKTVAKLTKPLKSIIKKNQQDKAKMTRRESDNKRREFLEGFHVAGSPKHSMSVSTALSSSYNGGEALDPSMVSVQVVRSNSKTRVDQIELLPPSGLILGAKSDHQHRRTNSFPDSASLLRNGDHVVSSNSKTSSINCSKETPLLGEEPRSSSESLNTALWWTLWLIALHLPSANYVLVLNWLWVLPSNILLIYLSFWIFDSLIVILWKNPQNHSRKINLHVSIFVSLSIVTLANSISLLKHEIHLRLKGCDF